MQNNKYKFVTKLETDKEYQKLADNLLAFAQKETSLDINVFPLALMIKPDDFFEFSTRSTYFANAYDTALRLIGARIKQLMYQGTIDRHFALEMLPFYDPEYRQYLREKKQKDEAFDGKQKFITVMIPSFGDAPDDIKNIVEQMAIRGYSDEERAEMLGMFCDLLNGCSTKESFASMAKLAERINEQWKQRQPAQLVSL